MAAWGARPSMWLVVSSICACTSGEPARTRNELSPPQSDEPRLTPTEAPGVDERRKFKAGKRPGARELVASYTLEHRHQDLMHFTDSYYDANVRLVIGSDGRADLEFVGSLAVESVEHFPEGGGTSQPRRELGLDETWSGEARMLDTELIVRFDRSTAYTPPMTIDVVWICSPKSLAVASADVSAWQCATTQTGTQPSGPAHDLDVHLQIPIMLAAPSERLHVDAQAEGGADNRSRINSATYSCEP